MGRTAEDGGVGWTDASLGAEASVHCGPEDLVLRPVSRAAAVTDFVIHGVGSALAARLHGIPGGPVQPGVTRLSDLVGCEELLEVATATLADGRTRLVRPGSSLLGGRSPQAEWRVDRSATGCVASPLGGHDRTAVPDVAAFGFDPCVVLVAVRDAAARIVDFEVTQANEAAAQYFGAPMDEVVGTRLLEQFPHHATSGLTEQYVRAIELQVPVAVDDVALASDGSGPGARYDVRGVPSGERLTLTWRNDSSRARIVEEYRSAKQELELLADHVADWVMRCDTADRVVYASPRVAETLGWDPRDLVDHRLAEFVHPEDQLFRAAMQQAAAEQGRGAATLRFMTTTGLWRWYSVVARVTRDAAGRVTGCIGAGVDVDEQIRTQERLEESEALYRTLVENSGDIIHRTGPDGTIEWVSPQVERLLGWTPEECMQLGSRGLVHPDDMPQLRTALDELHEGRTAALRCRLRMKDDGWRWANVVQRPLIDEAGMYAGSITSTHDAQAEVEALQDLAISEERFRTALDAAPNGTVLLDLDRRIEEVNPAFCEMVGLPSEALVGRRLPELLSREDDRIDLRGRALLVAGSGDVAETEGSFEHPDGRTVWFSASTALIGSAEEPRGFISQFLDVTLSRQAGALLAYEATHDPLTMTGNRRMLYTELESILARTPRTGNRIGVIFVDIDDFKEINDTFGHAAGDEVLIEVAERIRSSVRTDDVIARFGGDEFVITLPSVHGIDNVLHVAELIIEAMRSPIATEAAEIDVTISLGLAVGDIGEEVDDLLTRADRAVFEAKRLGGARFAIAED
jgi:diguanylate cyclase (GGDEF)-like protein/PAS domain S-box-containing protein